MIIKTCPQCKKEFQAKANCRKYCCQRCQWDAKKVLPLDKQIKNKKCSKCKIEKDVQKFWKQKEGIGGLHSWCIDCTKKSRKPKTITSECKNCGKIITRKIYKYDRVKWMCPHCSINIIIQKNGGKTINYTGTSYFTGSNFASWKSSAKRRKKEWSIIKKDLVKIYEKQKGMCALSGVQMELFTNSPYRISIDRIDSSKSYVVENTQFVCSIVNVMKNKFPEDVFIKMCEKIYLNKSS